VPTWLTVIAFTALLAGVLVISAMLAWRGRLDRAADTSEPPHTSPTRDGTTESEAVDSTLRVAWWLTITIVLLGVGISGSFVTDQAPIFLLGAGAVVAVIAFHELIGSEQRTRLLRAAELVTALALVSGLVALTGYASSPFAMLFALAAVAAALAHGPRAGLSAALLATVAFGAVLLIDPGLVSYGAEDALRLSVGLVATWLLAFVAIAYAGHQRRTVARAITLSRTDPLTGLANRSQLFVTLEQEVSRTRRSDRGFCILMIDLDGLKAVNDSVGHLRGDEVLRSLGQVIRGSIRTVDSCYRYGGDEFVVLLPETDIVGAFVVAEKIRVGAEELGMSIAGAESLTSVSIGLVSHPEDGLSAEELMTAADRAMYQAKKLGKNQISGNPRPRPALLTRRSTTAGSPVAVPVVPEPSPPVPSVEEHETVEPVAAADGSIPEPSEGRQEDDEDQPDPAEMRRQFAAASRSFDPDHQVRRAMDAFFSPSSTERDRPTPDH
jgi:diguanylate cyclase (GGDEF)-like protein